MIIAIPKSEINNNLYKDELIDVIEILVEDDIQVDSLNSRCVVF